MKRLMLLLPILIAVTVSGLRAQETNTSEYLFEDFQNALVIYKDGRQFQVEVNYSLIDGWFLFIDRHDNDIKKQFAEPEKISAIRVEDRTFLLTKRGAKEVLQFNPLLCVQYKGKIREPDKKVAYGGRSATSAVQNYSGIQSAGIWHPFEGERLILAGINKVYELEKDGKAKTFRNENQFLKLYPKQKDELSRYIRDNGIDFNEIDHVIHLYNYVANNYK